MEAFLSISSKCSTGVDSLVPLALRSGSHSKETRAAPAAKAFFETLTGANRYAVLYRVNDAKKPQTRAERIAKFVGMLSRGETLHPGK